MNTISDARTRQQLIQRISTLSTADQAAWGTMTPFRMVRHCVLSEEVFLGHKKYSRLFAGRIFGRMVLNRIIRDGQPMKKNQPTHPALKIGYDGALDTEKERWISLLQAYEHFHNPHFVHPFFGKMNKEEVGRFVYKHTDHHLRQFGR